MIKTFRLAPDQSGDFANRDIVNSTDGDTILFVSRVIIYSNRWLHQNCKKEGILKMVYFCTKIVTFKPKIFQLILARVFSTRNFPQFGLQP